MLTKHTFDTDVVSINYVEGPSLGSPLVLLSGITGWWQSWLPVIPYLLVNWHIYALDYRGHGRSGRVTGEYQWEAYAEDTLSFLETRADGPVILIGHLLGAMVAIQIAAQIPEAVRALVLEDPPLFNYRGSRQKESLFFKFFVVWRDLARTEYSLQEWLPVLAELNPEDHAAGLRHRAKSLSLLDPDVLTQLIDGSATENYDIETYLPRISCPALILRGEPDLGGQIEEQDTERVVSLLPSCAIVPMPGVGHLIHNIQPVEFSRVVIDFLVSL